LKKYDFRKSKQYLLLYKEKNYDSKPIYGVAHGFATDEFLTAKDFSGDFDHAAGYLVDLGFNVPEPVKAAEWIISIHIVTISSGQCKQIVKMCGQITNIEHRYP